MSDAGQQQSKIAEIIGYKELKTFGFYVSLLYEFFYTCLLFLMIFSISSVPNSASPDPLHIAFSFGLLLSTIYFQASKLCDCHLNPAITFGFMCCGITPVLRSICYIIMQCCGGIIAGLRFYKVDKDNIGACCAVDDNVSLYTAFLLEMVTTHFFVYVAKYVDVLERRNKQYMLSSLFYGLSFAAGYLITVSSTGGGMNPARCIGPALWLECWSYHWIFWAAPMLGGLTGAWFCKTLDQEENKAKEEVKEK